MNWLDTLGLPTRLLLSIIVVAIMLAIYWQFGLGLYFALAASGVMFLGALRIRRRYGGESSDRALDKAMRRGRGE
jgi:hypothetical protein